MKAPVKPFETFKWRWLSVTPSEGLLATPVFLGVLRALHTHEGEKYSSIALHEELKKVRSETDTDVDLARTPERNLFRNSGQYWRGTGLLSLDAKAIQLTDTGRKLAQGEITSDEFAALVISNTVLPNLRTYSEDQIAQWQNAGLRIKPFELILAVMDALGRKSGIQEARLTSEELIKIVIPLSGAKASIKDMTVAVDQFRKNSLDITHWPNCAPRSNDHRMAKEFLLFLRNFGVCVVDEDKDGVQSFHLRQLFNKKIKIDAEPTFLEDESLAKNALASSKDSEIAAIIERKRVRASIIRRTKQPKFRRDVLSASGGECVLTGEKTTDVLEAAHIIPAKCNGVDHVSNGLCMRVDIHRLYDSGKIRLRPDGGVYVNEQIQKAVSYGSLPQSIVFPGAVDLKNVIWRDRYL